MTAYMDRHGTLKRNDRNWTREEQLAGRQEPTQVKRALDELGIQVIYALSPQAKGRVERLWGTLQDRLVSELRLAAADTAALANLILAKYRLDHNRRFSIAAHDSASAWRRCPPGFDATEVCCLQYIRVVQNNNTVQIGKRVIDIKRHRSRATFAKAIVTVRHLLDGEYRVLYEGTCIATAQGEVPTEPVNQARSVSVWSRRREQRYAANRRKRVTESLAS